MRIRLVARRGIGGDRLQAEFLDEAAPLLVARHADEQLPTGDREDLVDRPGAAPCRHRKCRQTGHGHAGHMRGHQERRALEQRAADALTLAGGLALAQGGLHRDHAEYGAEDVDDGGAGAQRLAGRPGHVGQPDVELHHLVQRRTVLVGACQVALEGEVDEARVDLRQRFVAAAQSFHRAGAVVLDHHVGGRGQAVHGRLALGALEVERQAALVAVEGGEEARRKAAEPPRVVAARRRLHLHHVGAELGEHQAGRRAHHRMAELENLQPGQRRRGHQAALRRNASRLPAWISSLGS